MILTLTLLGLTKNGVMKCGMMTWLVRRWGGTPCQFRRLISLGIHSLGDASSPNTFEWVKMNLDQEPPGTHFHRALVQMVQEKEDYVKRPAGLCIPDGGPSQLQGCRK